jgi:hypothetical protein
MPDGSGRPKCPICKNGSRVVPLPEGRWTLIIQGSLVRYFACLLRLIRSGHDADRRPVRCGSPGPSSGRRRVGALRARERCVGSSGALLTPSPPAEKAHSSRYSDLFWTDGCCTGTVLIVVHHMGAASNGGRFRIEADAQPSSVHTNPGPSRDRPALGSVAFPRCLFN